MYDKSCSCRRSFCLHVLRGITIVSEQQPSEGETLAELNRLFVRSLRGMADAGQVDEACRIAAEGWSRLRHVAPREAERLNGVMHYMTGVTGKASKTGPVTRGDR